MRTSTQKRQSSRGFTLLELILVIVFIGILVLLAYAGSKGIRERISTGNCIGNMKSLYLSFDSYVKDNGHWPQQPWTFEDEGGIWEWWIKELEPYGGSPGVWVCPIDGGAMDTIPEYHSSYIPATFDSNAITPYLWNQPWLLERGAFHRDGNFMLMPKGDVKPASEFSIPGR